MADERYSVVGRRAAGDRLTGFQHSVLTPCGTVESQGETDQQCRAQNVLEVRTAHFKYAGKE